MVEARRSIRRFEKDQKIPQSDLDRILETCIKAPSAGNCQSWDFIVVSSEESKKDLARAALSQGFVAQAPIVIVVCANIERSAIVYGSRGRDLYCIQDTAAAIQTMLLTITAMGYAACWVGAFNEKIVSDILKIPREIRPVAIIPIGFPKIIPIPTPRIPIQELIHHETW